MEASGKTDKYSVTGTVWLVNAGMIVVSLGKERPDSSADGERRWLEKNLRDVTSASDIKSWGIMMDFKQIKAEQANTVGAKELFTWLGRESKIGSIAVVKAGKGYQLIIRATVFAQNNETGKVKFFDNPEMAEEWLKLKKR
jgi:hypothetical protein